MTATLNDNNFDWGSLESHVGPDGQFRPPARKTGGKDAKTQRFPCTACGGSGKYRGVRRHQLESKCFPCGGKGYFMTSERDREKARGKRVDSKARRLEEARAAFDAQHPDLAAFLGEAAAWSEFAASMLAALAEYGALTERQAIAAQSMRAKSEERKAARQAERQAGNATVDLAPIRAMFEAAVGSGYKRPQYRAAGLEISRAPDHGRNPGALYVVAEGGDYLGKIIGTAYTGKPAPALAAIALDPRGEAVRWGQRTGRCSCCGRLLTVGASIDAGIGPVCASKWGL